MNYYDIRPQRGLSWPDVCLINLAIVKIKFILKHQQKGISNALETEVPWQKEVPGMPKKKETDFEILKALENVHIIPSTLERHTILLGSMNITLANYDQQENLYLVIIKEING